MKPRGDGEYVMDFGTPEMVNALLADLNAHHRNEVIDQSQFLQCAYALVPTRR